jgi:hypothetical protein
MLFWANTPNIESFHDAKQQKQACGNDPAISPVKAAGTHSSRSICNEQSNRLQKSRRNCRHQCLRIYGRPANGVGAGISKQIFNRCRDIAAWLYRGRFGENLQPAD